MTAVFLVHNGTLYFPSVPFLHSRIETPVTALIRGVWEHFPDRALAILRERIYTCAPLTPLCQGMIKVCAKRATVLSSGEFEDRLHRHPGPRTSVPEPSSIALSRTTQRFSPGDAPPLGPCGALEILMQLKEEGFRKNPVSAVLMAPDGRLISFGTNSAPRNRSAHAELNLIQSYCQSHPEPIPPGSKLFVTLRPCAMCSAQILSALASPFDLEVLFLEEDPGPASKNSCYFRGSELWKKAGSPEVRIRQLDLNAFATP